jgi:hypothetical protein
MTAGGDDEVAEVTNEKVQAKAPLPLFSPLPRGAQKSIIG